MMGDEEEQDIPRRFVPQNELEFNLLTTDPEWGRQANTDDFKQIMGKLHSVLKMYTRDQRLANLDRYEDLPRVRTFNRLAGDLIFSEMLVSASVAIHNSANILETSQSKSGFLRRRMGTFTQEQFRTELEPKKKSIFGGYKDQDGAR